MKPWPDVNHGALPIIDMNGRQGRTWSRISLRMEGVDPDEAAGALAETLGQSVEMGEDGLIHVWLDNKDRHHLGRLMEGLRSAFPSAKTSLVGEETVPDEDWLALWRRSVTPIPLGDRIIVAPTFHPPPPGHGRLEVILDPGMAFGSGHHPSTRLCAEALERLSPEDTLDIGCGSGILAIIAARLGAKRALGVDNDPEAARVARENVDLNHLGGTVAIIAAGPEAVAGEFGVITANLFQNAHLALAGEYMRLLRPGGRVILSGLKTDQAAAVEERMGALGLALEGRMEKDGWTALIFGKPTVIN